MPHKTFIAINKNHVELTKKRNKFTGKSFPIIVGGQLDSSTNRLINSSTFGMSLGSGLESLHFRKNHLPKHSANIQFIA